MLTFNEKELVKMAQNGSEHAFQQLVEANMRRIYGLALRFTSRHDEADDMAQETFIRAYRALDKFQGNSSFGTWVYKIAINCCLSRRRKLNRIMNAEVENHNNDQMADNKTPSQERVVISSQAKEKVEEALDTLSRQQRAVFVMRHLQDKKIAEIAQILECATGTVKQQLFRAVRKVREHLRPILGINGGVR